MWVTTSFVMPLIAKSFPFKPHHLNDNSYQIQLASIKIVAYIIEMKQFVAIPYVNPTFLVNCHGQTKMSNTIKSIFHSVGVNVTETLSRNNDQATWDNWRNLRHNLHFIVHSTHNGEVLLLF